MAGSNFLPDRLDCAADFHSMGTAGMEATAKRWINWTGQIAFSTIGRPFESGSEMGLLTAATGYTDGADYCRVDL